LIVECLSPSNRKGSIQELLADYARIAAPEVWLLDPKPPQFTAYRYESGALKQWLATESGRVTPLLLPNVAVDLSPEAQLADAAAGTHRPRRIAPAAPMALYAPLSNASNSGLRRAKYRNRKCPRRSKPCAGKKRHG
jgi:hypothetical protein